jgi:hypothetical protein
MNSVFGSDRVYVKKVIEEIYDNKPISISSTAPSLLRLKRDLKANADYDVYIVMAPYGVHNYLHKPVRLYTILRNPVDRCISMLRFMHSKPGLNDVNKLVVSFGNNYKQLLDSKRILCFRNEQVRLISGSTKWKIDEVDYKIALDRLNGFDEIFKFGEFDKIERLCKAHGATRSCEFPKLNSFDIKLDLSDSDRKMLSEYNTYDQKLWRHVRSSSSIQHHHNM